MTLKILLCIAFGGAVGAVGRFVVSNYANSLMQGFGSAFPLGTLTVNVVGSFIMGCVVELSTTLWSPSPELKAMISVGMLGAFTTFSTFSLDSVSLFSKGEIVQGALYIALSVIISICALLAGLYLVKALT